MKVGHSQVLPLYILYLYISRGCFDKTHRDKLLEMPIKRQWWKVKLEVRETNLTFYTQHKRMVITHLDYGNKLIWMMRIKNKRENNYNWKIQTYKLFYIYMEIWIRLQKLSSDLHVQRNRSQTTFTKYFLFWVLSINIYVKIDLTLS